ncbi:hypothetical protein SAMN05421823_10711 [Catalinimonas alkaloidigena]|uniref:Glycosyltransferase 2-like domain-containing protein n=1 Tax=Catalinimonas alkaloidigena TaxID=1075417 RepID=A0A1G9LCX2_9BACT|nr:glycosyltransferase family 2 protein [Catalinimonas alkaloidigena]SDL59849.1 hypothetical protein SAMN05421823_10711 [Catalinimonas alkaloidigena]
MIDVSIIIVNYNTAAFTRTCIQSVFEKTKQVSFEVILVDNASTECDPDTFEAEFPAIKLIKSERNVGFAKGNNLGLQQAKGKYILLLNSDTALINDAVSLAVHKMEQDRTIGALSAQLLHADGRIQPVSGRFFSISMEVRELLRLNKRLTPPERADQFLGPEFDHRTEKEVDWIWGAFFMIPREVVEQFPERKLHDDFFMYIEDVQWCYAIQKLGYKVMYFPEAKAYHYISASSPSLRNEKEKYYQKTLPNAFKLMQLVKGKHYPYIYYAIKAVHLLTLRRASDRHDAWRHVQFLTRQLLTSTTR